MARRHVLLFIFFSGFYARAEFPRDWFGHWRGVVTMTTAESREQQEFAMNLEIAPIAKSKNIKWHIQYEGEPVRQYVLRPVPKYKDTYVLDEKNGILIGHYFLGGVLQSAFTVNGRLFKMELRLEQDGHIKQTGVVYELQAPINSGGGNVPPVQSFKLYSCDEALLERVNQPVEKIR